MSTIRASSSVPSASNSTISSSRFRNSGLNELRTTPITASRLSLGVERLVGQELRAQVGGQDHDHVPEVDRTALAVGQPAVVEHLQQDVEDLAVGLLDLVQQHDRVRAPPDGLGELAALLVADVAGRRTDQPGRPSASRSTRSCRSGPSRARRRTGTPPATWPARSCRRRSGRGTGTTRSAGWGRRCRPGSGVRRRTPRGPPVRWPISRSPSRSSMLSSFSVSPCSSRPVGMPVQLATTSAMSLRSDLLADTIGRQLALGRRRPPPSPSPAPGSRRS